MTRAIRILPHASLQVRFVYNLEPPEDAVAYLHRAGRAARIGSVAGGTVATLVSRRCVYPIPSHQLNRS